MNDNLARIPVPVHEDYDLLHQRQLERSKQKRQQKKRSFMGTVVSVGISVALAFGITTGYMRIFELEREISQNNNQLAVLKATNDQKEVSLESSMTLEQIEFEAKTRLGMNKPANNQIIYINIHTEDASHVVQ